MVQGFSFCPAVYQPHSSVYSGFSVVRAIYTATEPKPFTELCSGVSADFTHSSAHNTAATQAAYTPPVSCWRAYRQALHLHQYQIQPPRWTLHSLAQPPIIIRYIRIQGCAPVMDSCQTEHHSADHTSPAAGGLAPGQQCRARRIISMQGTVGGTTGGYRRTSFRAFAR